MSTSQIPSRLSPLPVPTRYPAQGPYGPQPPLTSHHLRNWLLNSSRAVVGVIVITVAACSLTGSNSQSGPDMLSIGDHTIIGEGNSTTAGLMVSDLTVSTQPDDQSSNTPVHGYFVTVTATAVVGQDSTNGFDIGPLDFYAEVNGTHYGEGNGNAEYAISDPSMELSETILGAGEKTSGELLFNLPSRHGYIVYAPNANGQPLAEWKY